MWFWMAISPGLGEELELSRPIRFDFLGKRNRFRQPCHVDKSIWTPSAQAQRIFDAGGGVNGYSMGEVCLFLHVCFHFFLVEVLKVTKLST